MAAAAAGAGAILHAVGDGRPPDRVHVIGTPAEEGGAGKVALLDAGVFRGVDAALMVHPLPRTRIYEALLGRSKLTVEFFGKPAHAAAYSDEGVNALDAMVLHLQGIAAMRQQLRPQARVHGIVTHGGDAPNIIPEHTAAVFYVRALDPGYLREVVRRFEACAHGAAQATGTRAKVTAEPFLYEPMRMNRTLSERLRVYLAAAGVLPLTNLPPSRKADLPVLPSLLVDPAPPDVPRVGVE
ncbi:MAG TPA: peptidase dimerization domain-containing protein [Methylomirabilota bacterium]|nr:peptidase dimerization domain-containing protein [Methylomirabilota bacterium]